MKISKTKSLLLGRCSELGIKCLATDTEASLVSQILAKGGDLPKGVKAGKEDSKSNETIVDLEKKIEDLEKEKAKTEKDFEDLSKENLELKVKIENLEALNKEETKTEKEKPKTKNK